MNPFVLENISDMEKIDRIYRMLHAERRARWIWRGIKVALLWLIVFGYYYISDPDNSELRAELNRSFQVQISAIVTPMVEGVVWDMTKNILNWGLPATSTTGAVQHRNIPRGQNITPEMMRAIQSQGAR